MSRLRSLWARVQRSVPWRATMRYGETRAGFLAGGVAYYAFFSIFPAVALAFTVFGVVLRGRPEVLESVRETIDRVLPGFVRHGDTGLIPIEAPSVATLSWAGAIGVVGLLWAGLGWLTALRTGIRMVLGAPGSPGNPVTAKLRDLGVLLILGVAVVLSSVVAGIAGTTTRWLTGLVGLHDQWWVLTLVSVVVGVLLDGAIVLVMLRVLSGVNLPWRGLREAALVGGAGLTGLKVAGTSLLGAMSNPLYASIALVVGLLLWLNLMSRVVLFAAAWAATLCEALESTSRSPERGGASLPGEGPRRPGRPVDVATSDAAARVDAPLPTFGVRAADRTTLVAGAVLGATVAMGAGGALRRLWRLVRR